MHHFETFEKYIVSDLETQVTVTRAGDTYYHA